MQFVDYLLRLFFQLLHCTAHPLSFLLLPPCLRLLPFVRASHHRSERPAEYSISNLCFSAGRVVVRPAVRSNGLLVRQLIHFPPGVKRQLGSVARAARRHDSFNENPVLGFGPQPAGRESCSPLMALINSAPGAVFVG